MSTVTGSLETGLCSSEPLEEDAGEGDKEVAPAIPLSLSGEEEDDRCCGSLESASCSIEHPGGARGEPCGHGELRGPLSEGRLELAQKPSVMLQLVRKQVTSATRELHFVREAHNSANKDFLKQVLYGNELSKRLHQVTKEKNVLKSQLKQLQKSCAHQGRAKERLESEKVSLIQKVSELQTSNVTLQRAKADLNSRAHTIAMELLESQKMVDEFNLRLKNQEKIYKMEEAGYQKREAAYRKQEVLLQKQLDRLNVEVQYMRSKSPRIAKKLPRQAKSLWEPSSLSPSPYLFSPAPVESHWPKEKEHLEVELSSALESYKKCVTRIETMVSQSDQLEKRCAQLQQENKALKASSSPTSSSSSSSAFSSESSSAHTVAQLEAKLQLQEEHYEHQIASLRWKLSQYLGATAIRHGNNESQGL